MLGFRVSMRYGDKIVFMSFDDEYHHRLALNSGPSEGQPPPPTQAPGMLHVAILYPTALELAQAARKVLESGVEIFAASDHGNSLGLYLRDPDQLEIELTWDRPQTNGPATPGEPWLQGCDHSI
ncbi:MAG: VOC family protein [Actinobacteria bacterium]|nr:VOC family protein [Actinomycetota bacterium]